MRARSAAAMFLLLVAGCSYQNYQSDFGSASIQDQQFLTLFWIFVAVCAVMYVLVLGFMIAAMIRRNRTRDLNVVETGRHHRSHPALTATLTGWAALIGIGLAILAVASFVADRSMAQAATNEKLAIRITGNQWWWDIVYKSDTPSKTLRTANELHLPVGVPTRIYLNSADVIHSFWVPSLGGKQDLIPGRENDITVTPTKAGIYRGQCAEFCGVQHAKMAMVVVVEPYADFVKWWDAQLQPAAPPRTPEQLAGFQYVTSGPCSACHNIGGTPASGQIAPDLTHIASRRSLAAGTLPMNRGNLHGWIADPQSLKPGNKMPTIGMEAKQLHGVVAYLESLK
ncbi:MAG TPA: cytochrome c oxidase subunit II [Sphingomicrobium sp.]